MPPEQLHGRRELDGRADVYSLGVLLYELLALQPPFRGSDFLAVQRQVLGEAPEPLRVRNRQVPADAETVVRTAMERDPARRYAGARALALDLENLLERRPIAARPPGPALRLRRWSQRRPALATGLVAGFLLFVLGPTFFLVRELQHSGRLEEALAQESAARRSTTRAMDFLVSLFRASDPRESRGLDVPAREVLARGVEQLRGGVADDPLLRGSLLYYVGEVYTALGEPALALPLLEEALAIERRERGPGALTVAAVLDVLGGAHRQLGDDRAAEAHLREALAIQRAQRGEDHLAVAGALNNLALVLQRSGDRGEAEECMRRAAELYERDGEASEARLAQTLSNLAILLAGSGRRGEAEEQLERARAIQQRVHEPPHPALIATWNTLGMLRKQRGDLEGAAGAYGEALAQQEQLFGAESLGGATLLFNLYKLRMQGGERAEAERLLRRAQGILERVAPPDHPTALLVHAEVQALEQSAD